MGKNGILKNKAGEQIFPATTADQVAWNDRMNLKQAISEKLGAPYAASTVSSMTDRTRIYVYIGDESGYTKGNWYYWNGSSWVSGGVYNSVAVETDKTLTVAGKAADGEVVGQEIGSLKESLDELKNSKANISPLEIIRNILDKSVFIEDVTGLFAEFDAILYEGMYRITYNLNNITASNGINAVEEGARFTVTLTAEAGYKLATAAVTMGGVDVTESVYVDGTITIESVTGDVVITATTIDAGLVLLKSIAGDGNSYIDTEVTPEKTHRYEISYTLVTGEESPLFGVDCYAYGSAYYGVYLESKDRGTSFIGRANLNTFSNIGSWNNTENNLLTNKQAYFVMKDGSQEVYLDAEYTTKQTSYTAGTSSWDDPDMPPYPLYLFAVNMQGTSNKHVIATHTLYWFKIYDDSTNELLHEFVPAMNGTKIGMYDTVTEKFHENKGTGTFAYEEVA